MRTPHWSTRLELLLAEPGALRVLNTASIVQVARNVRPAISKPSVERWIQDAVAANRLQRVVRGLFLNRLVAPAAQLCEAAVWLRPGKVTAIVPLSSRYTTPSLGRVEAGAGTFVFRGIPERVLEAGAERDRFAAGFNYRRSTPEAALLHWLYLCDSPRSRMSAPPLDLDLAALDMRRLRRLAKAMRLDPNFSRWRELKYPVAPIT